MKHLFYLLLLVSSVLHAQRQPLTYFLPENTYDKNVPSPEQFLGWQVGEWHVTHDQLTYYMRQLASTSKRVQWTEYGRTHEMRPMQYLAISSEANLKRLEEIRLAHLQVSDPKYMGATNLSQLPLVVYLGYSVHGNEASGGNASLLVAYYLAAAKSADVERLLDSTIILIDPCFNPDGFQRFSTWVNQHKSKHLATASADREFNEVWPGGRFNHYWFDLNRDWLFSQHPESQARIALFQRWMPNILTDHHEMGTNGTFFFQPGIPTQINPFVPAENTALTSEIAQFHVAALDKIGSMYYSGESFDDYFAGKGSTYTDLNGCIGILFEQASARGHLQDSENGPLSFAYAIRNHVTSSLSTLTASRSMRTKLLEYQQRFYRDALVQAVKDTTGGYVYSAKNDPIRVQMFNDMLKRHHIEISVCATDIKAGTEVYKAGEAFVVAYKQPQYRLVKNIFERFKTFKDSAFYDVSAWTLPLAYDLEYAILRLPPSGNLTSLDAKNGVAFPVEKKKLARSNYAYVLEWSNYLAPRALGQLQQKGIIAKVASKRFVSRLGDGTEKTFEAGAILVPAENQPIDKDAIYAAMQQIDETCGFSPVALSSGQSVSGGDAGSPLFKSVPMMRALLLAGDGVSATDAGELWHLFDVQYEITIDIVDCKDLGKVKLADYTTLILADGNYNTISNVEAIKGWVQRGGNIVGFQGAVNWLASRDLSAATFRPEPRDTSSRERIRYAQYEDNQAINSVNGVILGLVIDLTNPIGFGYNDQDIALMRSGKSFMDLPKNPYASPLVYKKQPVMSGFLSSKLTALPSSAAGAVITAVGQGRVICFADNLAFRATWLGANKMIANAVFFGPTINQGTCERK